ncbi:MAG: DUF1559 domain-containing protein [Planctomycetes bacterium]|nr:DUF1559 domain-containing protein [Planctomycetota bacterium]
MSTLPDKLTCANGHTFSVPAEIGADEAGSDEDVSCPDCGERVPLSGSSAPRRGSKGRSLWAVMQGSEEVEAAPPDEVARSEESARPKESAASSAADDSDGGKAVAEAAPTPSETKEPNAPKPKSLWSVVESAGKTAPSRARKAAPDETATSDVTRDSAGEAASAEDSAAPDSASDDESERPRGLWAMMGQKQSAETPSDSAEVSEAGAAVKSESGKDSPGGTSSGGGGWNVVKDDDEGASLEELLDGDGDFEISKKDGATAVTTGPLQSEADEEGESADSDDNDLLDDDELDDDEHEEDGWEVEEYDQDDEEAVAAPSLVSPSIAVPLPTGPAINPGAKTAKLALGFGVAAFLVAVLNLLPGFWAKIPSTVAGLGALVWGYQSLNESKRSPDRAKLKLTAGGGLAFGLLGMFSGPMYLTAIGENWREEQLRNAISRNLSQIGEGVEIFYEHHSAFPRATYQVDGQIDIPMHSWMSALLPHMGYEQVAGQIDRARPYDDAANFEAMSTVIPTFLVPDVDHQPTLRGLATSHFAGVGGETLTAAGRVDVGVFSRGVTLNEEALSDGASQTMLAGEITKALPAWGEPGNWRTIDRGLNRQVSGFGNAAGTGAHFLMADGSVKFFPNATSRDVLVRLSTRNGDDPVTVPE